MRAWFRRTRSTCSRANRCAPAGFRTTATCAPLAELWGSFFSLAEHFNRDVAFIAAYRSAIQRNHERRADLRLRQDAVRETQGVLKANKANWARGAVGATIFTFKRFSISYTQVPETTPPPGACDYPWRCCGRFAGMSGMPFSDDLDDVIDHRSHAGLRVEQQGRAPRPS